jgi:hypothetical protein
MEPIERVETYIPILTPSRPAYIEAYIQLSIYIRALCPQGRAQDLRIPGAAALSMSLRIEE